jgi:hypothetical protein
VNTAAKEHREGGEQLEPRGPVLGGGARTYGHGDLGDRVERVDERIVGFDHRHDRLDGQDAEHAGQAGEQDPHARVERTDE